jgi:Utp11 protein
LGILEKHKDYVQRAKDFNQKKDKIKRLRQKVADRNKDEFYFGMVSKQTKVSPPFCILVWPLQCDRMVYTIKIEGVYQCL